MKVADAMRSALADGDVKAIAASLGTEVKNRHDVLKIMHMARTKAVSVPREKRLYSHQWLLDRGLPSMLPDEERPPMIVRAVGIAVSSQVPAVKENLTKVQEGVVLDAFARGEKDQEKIKAAMKEAREKEMRGLMLVPGERAK